MANVPNLLNDDGTASMATAFLTSHHGLRRDIAAICGGAGSGRSPATTSTVEPLRAEWKHYRDTLHGHHMMEDTVLFPSLKEQHPELAAVIDGLTADHRKIDPMLEEGDRAFAELAPAQVRPAVRVVEAWAGCCIRTSRPRRHTSSRSSGRPRRFRRPPTRRSWRCTRRASPGARTASRRTCLKDLRAADARAAREAAGRARRLREALRGGLGHVDGGQPARRFRTCSGRTSAASSSGGGVRFTPSRSWWRRPGWRARRRPGRRTS